MKQFFILSSSLLVSSFVSAQEIPQTPQCQDFHDFATQRKIDPRYISSSHAPLSPFETDTLLVQKDGEVQYAWNDPLYTSQNPRVQWSISKMITMTLVGASIEAGTLWNGQPLSLDTRLEEIFPNPGPKVESKAAELAKYRSLTLRHLVEMSAGYQWKEYYDSDVQDSSFLPMLYMPQGLKNMAAFALNQKFFAEQPGNRWIYSGGNANIVMAALEKIHETNPNFMDELLFKPLGITSWRLERDQSGHGIGSSYFYLNTQDMAKLGQLYLDQGVAPSGQRILSEQWIVDSQKLAPSMLNEATSLDVIKKLGAGSKRLFWLNTDIYRNGQLLYPKEFPEAPEDLYFAAGHYGQLIIVIPSEKVVIARTGRDILYWDHIQPLVVKALSCFSPSFKPNEVDSLLPPSAGSKKNQLERILSSIGSMPSQMKTVHFLRHSGVAASALSKELCSFAFTQELSPEWSERQLVQFYKERSGLPDFAQTLLLRDLDIRLSKQKRSVEVSGSLLSPFPWKSARAEFLGSNKGCQITKTW